VWRVFRLSPYLIQIFETDVRSVTVLYGLSCYIIQIIFVFKGMT